MFEKLIEVVQLSEPLPTIEAPQQESSAHKEWVKRKQEFIQSFCGGQEPGPEMQSIMIASIGEEPDFS